MIGIDCLLSQCNFCHSSLVLILVPAGNELELKNSSTGLVSQSIQKRQAWVLCDDCQKWRCIPTALADTIEQTNCNWYGIATAIL